MARDSTTADDILAQRVRLLYSQGSTAVAASVGAAALTAYYLWNAQSVIFVTTWLALLVVVSAFRLFLFQQFAASEPAASDLRTWLRWHIVASLLGGVCWGLLGLLYDPAWATGAQVVIFVVLAGVATAAVSSYAASLTSYAAFLVPLLLPLFVNLLQFDGQDAVHLRWIVVIFGAGLFGMARHFHAHIIGALHLAIEQQSLQQALLTGTKQLENIERALRNSELRFGQVLESSLDGFWDWNIANHTVYFSPRYKAQLGFADHELQNDFSSWESRLHPDDWGEIRDKLDAYLKHPWGYWEAQFRLRHKDGSYRWILSRAVPTLGDENRPVRLTGVHIDVTDRVRSQREIERLAYHDWLTQLPNRALLTDRLAHAVSQAKRSGGRVLLLFVDLDQFKHVNDSLGHSVGDDVLRQVASRLTAQIREGDTVGRLSGDEFCVLMEGAVETDDAIVAAENVLDGLRQPFVVEEHEFNLGASIGISAFPDDGEDAATLLRNAGAAMHRAKNDGRNRFHFYSEELTKAAFRHVKLEHGLRQALAQNHLHVYYQPKLCIRTGRVLGAEALVRWRHPEEGFISPGEFIPVAEESGLITELGDWVLKQACEDAAAWLRQGLAFEHVAVNVSGVQVQHQAFARGVKAILASTGLPAQCLELEVTEDFLMKDADASAVLLDELRSLGVSIAIDDFGTGYSSLAYLTRFPVNKLKIDRSFISRVCVDPQNAEISRAVINLGHSLNMQVVAEGIELETQLAFLQGEGCDEGQGYLFARPLPHDEFVAFVQGHTGCVAAQPSKGLARS